MKNNEVTSTPNFFTFNPKIIPYQYNVVWDIRNHFDFDGPPHFILLSGSVGSAKSTLMAWVIIDHCTKQSGARALIGRKAMPDLKDTIFQKLLEMLTGAFTEGVDYVVNLTSSSIRFKNGSEVISRSWHDKKYTKFRSLELSLIAIEEVTESDNKEAKYFEEIIARLGRLPHIKENIFIGATNPDDPSHWAYDFWIKGAKRTHNYAVKNKTRHTYYSLTKQNPFLPSWYTESLREKYDEKMVRRMLMGEWLYISTDVIYYNYEPEIHLVDTTRINKKLPITITLDFNIQKGKPNSSAMYQFNPRSRNVSGDRRFSFKDEVAVEGARTSDIMDEWQGKGVFDLPHNPHIIIHGDATGKHGSTKTVHTDYDIIEKFLNNYIRQDEDVLSFSIDVMDSNPALRSRHNYANGAFKNSEGVVSIEIDRKCSMIDKGFSNTRLKEKAGYLEDQTTAGQDISTACTYGIYYDLEYEQKSKARITFR